MRIVGQFTFRMLLLLISLCAFDECWGPLASAIISLQVLSKEVPRLSLPVPAGSIHLCHSPIIANVAASSPSFLASNLIESHWRSGIPIKLWGMAPSSCTMRNHCSSLTWHISTTLLRCADCCGMKSTRREQEANAAGATRECYIDRKPADHESFPSQGHLRRVCTTREPGTCECGRHHLLSNHY